MRLRSPHARAGLGKSRVPVIALATAAALAVTAGLAVRAQHEPAPHDRGAAGLALALRRLPVGARVLYVTAHPDDEHNGVLVRLARGLGVRTGLLTLTRGDGGQNAIGPELVDALAVLRTEELAAVHRQDGALQYFGRSSDFGFSFSVEETFATWGHDEALGDVVRVVRDFRPDVMLTLSLEAPGGGQHHQAAARLAREAFRAAADPGRFPEQLRSGLRPWQPHKIYQGGVGGSVESLGGPPVRVPTGVYDPLLGMTWQELGAIARSSHRSQGAVQLRAGPGPAEGRYHLIDSEPHVEGAEADILDGVPLTVAEWRRFAAGQEEKMPSLAADLASLQERLEAARTAFDPSALERAVPALAEGLTTLVGLRQRIGEGALPPLVRDELTERLAVKEAEVQAALALAQKISFQLTADDGEVVPGQPFTVTARVTNQGASPAVVEELALALPDGWTLEGSPAGEGQAGERGSAARETLAAQAQAVRRWRVRVAPDARPTRPYWRRGPRPGRYEVDDPSAETLPWRPSDLAVTLRYTAFGATSRLRRPVVHRYEGPFVGGEKQHEVQVVPAFSVRLAPEVAVVPVGVPAPTRELRVNVTSNTPGAAQVVARLRLPDRWSVRPAEAPLTFQREGEEIPVRFRVTPPPGLRAGESAVQAEVVHEGRVFAETVQVVAYEHTERRQLVRPAAARVLAIDVRAASGASIGYVMGPGDAVADAIAQLGLPVTLLTPDDLAFGDLSRYTTVVTGIRAYETRADLRSFHHRLMRYVEAGGHLVVQYNRAAFNSVAGPGRPGASALAEGADSPFAPYPASVTSNRITDETAPLRVLVPAHPLFTRPNRIGPADWEGWVQERGIQFLATRDPRYVELLAGSDPFPKNPGEQRGILVEATVGRGTWTYVGLVLFRQLPAGVPGAYRLLANLVSRPGTAPVRPRP